MRFLALAALTLTLLAALHADAAYMPAGTTTIINPAGQDVGISQPNNATPQPTLPIITTPGPQYAPVPSPPPSGISKWGTFLDSIGKVSTYITDGINYLSFAPPNGSPQPGQASGIFNLSPNPSLQCPFTAPVNQTASATVIANPGGKLIHVCGIVLIDATQQGVTVAEGTGTNCGTGTAYWDGGSGGTMQFSANGGYSVTNFRIIYPMQAVGDNVCVIQASTGNVSGHINYGVFNR